MLRLLLCFLLILPLVNVQAQSDARTTVLGGQNTDIEEVPWQIALALADSTASLKERVFCGGTIVSPVWVITAAHCVFNQAPERLSILSGLSSLVTDTPTETGVAEIIIHPQYSNGSFRYDLALIRLSAPIDTSQYPGMVVPVISAAESAAGVDSPGTEALISGYGAIEESGTTPDSLQSTRINIIATADVAAAYDEIFGTGSITEDMLPAGVLAGGTDTCQGDSGGPLVVSTPNGNRLAGVTSWGAGCGQPNLPGIYTRLSLFANWIEEQQLSAAPPTQLAPVDLRLEKIIGQPTRLSLAKCGEKTTLQRLLLLSNQGTATQNAFNLRVSLASTEQLLYDSLINLVLVPQGAAIVGLELNLAADITNDDLVIAVQAATTDAALEDNRLSIPFEVRNGYTVTVTTLTDDYPDETIWELLDASTGETLVQSNGGIGYSEEFTLFTEQLCLPEGNYTFTATDLFGDGFDEAGYVKLEITSETETFTLINTAQQSYYQESVNFSLPYEPVLDLAVNIVAPTAGTDITTCSDSLVVAVEVINKGTLAVESYVLEATLNGQQQRLTVNAPLYSGQRELLVFDRLLLGSGNNSTNFNLAVNIGHADSERTEATPADNSSSQAFSISVPEMGNAVSVVVKTDDYPEETQYTITGSDSVVYRFASGGLNIASEYRHELCLKEGYYFLSIADEYGDGISPQTGETNVAQVFIEGATELLSFSGNFTYFVELPFLVMNTPTALTSTQSSNGELVLNWEDNTAFEDGYLVEGSTNGRTFSPITTLPADTDQYALTASPATTYRVVAVSAGFQSAPSNSTEGATLSTNEARSYSFTAFPNPSAGEVQLAWLPEAGTASLELINLSGRTCYTTTFDASMGQTNINFGTQPQGLYLLRLRTSSGYGVQRLVVK